MEQAQRAAAISSREPRSVRFVALRGPEPTTLLRFHPRLTVLSGFREDLVEWLAGAFARGPALAPSGFVVLDNARIAMSELPTDVYRQGRCPVVPATALDDDLLHRGEGSREKLGSEIDAVGAAIADAQRRTDEIVQRIAALDVEIAGAEADIARLQSPAGSQPATAAPRDRGDDADELQQLVDAVARAEVLEKVAHPDAEALAAALEAVDAKARRRRERADVEEDLRKWELVTAEARSRLAERRATAPRVSPADIAEATRLHEAVRQASDRRGHLLRRGNREEAAALEEQYEALLTRLGARSFSDLMLLGSGLGTADSDLAIREATNVVSAAERRCADLRAELAQPGIDQLREERAELLQRARHMLGGDGGANAIEALRRHRVEPQDLVDAQVALARRLRDFGAHVDGTVVDTARRLITQWREDSAQLERDRCESERRAEAREDAERVARQGRTMRARLSREIETRRTEIEDLEFDRRRLEARLRNESSNPDPVAMTPALVDRLVADVLDNDDVQRSALPVIVDDPFVALDPEHRAFALTALARRSGKRQIVLVTGDDSTVAWARNAGENVAIAWTADDSSARMMRQAV
jgi:hypothetical protein